jgi:hypothetical protein
VVLQAETIWYVKALIGANILFVRREHMNVIGRIWQAWKRFGKLVGDFIGRLVLTVFYFTIFLPFGVGVRLFGDPLDVKSKSPVHWLDRSTQDLSVDDVRRLS